ncbi:MAG: prepilin-type N-terminal cleavage/methylation domain-containing protein [Planctomycetota bacterium]
MRSAETRRKAGRRSDSGLTMLEVIVTLLILSLTALPLLIALADAQRGIVRSKTKRVMKQLLEYKLAHVLLDRPGEDEEPIYVDGSEGNFGEDFANDPDKAYWFSEDMYFYSYRIDSEEIDLGTSGGITGEEEETRQPAPTPESDPGGSPFGENAEEETEELGQLRYRVTLTVFYQPGNANFNQHMSIVTYVKHPHHKETMTGPEAQGGDGPGGLPGAAGGPGGEATIGGGDPNSGGNSGFSAISGGGRR